MHPPYYNLGNGKEKNGRSVKVLLVTACSSLIELRKKIFDSVQLKYFIKTKIGFYGVILQYLMNSLLKLVN